MLEINERAESTKWHHGSVDLARKLGEDWKEK